MTDLKISVFLNTQVSTAEPGRIAALARHGEAAGLDGIFVGDHIVTNRPFLDGTVVLAAVAAATDRLSLGFGVPLPALRPTALAAKQIAALQPVSGNRVVLGVGTGGAGYGSAGWHAAGVPFTERGARTDRALEVLPALVRGEPTRVNDTEAGVSHLVLSTAGADWRRQVDLISEARGHLT